MHAFNSLLVFLILQYFSIFYIVAEYLYMKMDFIIGHILLYLFHYIKYYLHTNTDEYCGLLVLRYNSVLALLFFFVRN